MLAHGISATLIASAVGYWVLTIAGKEKGRVQKLGQFLGVFILLVSLASAACKIACAVQACQAGYSSGKACPFGLRKGAE